MNVRPIEEGKLNTIVTPEIAFSHLFCYFSNAISGESSVLSQHFINRPKMVSSLKQEADSDHILAGLKCHLSISHLISNRCSYQKKVFPIYYQLPVTSKMLCIFNTPYITEFGLMNVTSRNFSWIITLLLKDIMLNEAISFMEKIQN